MSEEIPIGYKLRLEALRMALEWSRQDFGRPVFRGEIIKAANKFYAFMIGGEA